MMMEVLDGRKTRVFIWARMGFWALVRLVLRVRVGVLGVGRVVVGLEMRIH